MPQFRKKPVVIEARLFDGTPATGWPLREWIEKGVPSDHPQAVAAFDERGQRFLLRTLEGVMAAAAGDWIIKGVKGEFYPCKPDIFEATYEAV